MQVYHDDVYHVAQTCQNTSAFSFFFKNTGKANSFFNWQQETGAERSIDLSLLATKDIAFHYNISGYLGCDTVPPCPQQCWYMFEKVFDIDDTQLQFFKDAQGGKTATRNNPNPLAVPSY